MPYPTWSGIFRTLRRYLPKSKQESSSIFTRTLQRLKTMIKTRFFTVQQTNVIQCDHFEAIERIIEHLNEHHNALLVKNPLPSDSIETIMYRSGARAYRDLMLQEVQRVLRSSTR